MTRRGLTRRGRKPDDVDRSFLDLDDLRPWTVATLASYAGTAVAASALAIIFRTLLGWREGQPLQALS